MAAQDLRPVFVKAWRAWLSDQAPLHSAALAFYLLLALSPLLVFFTALFAALVHTSAPYNGLDRHLINTVRDALGQEQASFLQSIIQSAAKRNSGYLTPTLGVLVALFGASGLFYQLRSTVNTIWHVSQDGRHFGHWLVERFVAALSVIVVAAILSGWLAFDSWSHIVRRSFAPGTPHTLRQFISFVLAWCFWTPVYAALFKWIPAVRVAWRDVWLAGIMTSLSFAILKFVLSLYFSYSNLSVSYGAAGAVIVILLWAFYSCQIFLYGVEFSKAWSETPKAL